MKFITILSIIILSLSACSESNLDEKDRNQNNEFLEWVDSVWKAKVDRYPALKTEYGFHHNDDKWDNISDSMKLAEKKILTENLKILTNRFDVNNLSGQALKSFEIYVYNLETELAGSDFLFHDYPVSQMDGWHTKIPSILINQHKIDNVRDAQNYIARVEKVPSLISQLIDNLENRKERGVVAPNLILDYVIESSENLIVDESKIDSHPIFSDFKQKVEILSINDDKKDELVNYLNKVLTNEFSTGYTSLIEYLKELKNYSENSIGASSLPNGKKYYEYQLRMNNTIDITPEEVYEYGINEVERIHSEMTAIKEDVGFNGNLQEFFKFMREDSQFYFPNTKEGKQKYLDSATAIINTMKTELDQLFEVKPKTDLVVKKVEEYREKSAGKAFYEPPSIDGKRPGMYYANLYDMSGMPVYQMEALAYHEGIPGHHMQIAISQELENIPKFRVVGNLYVSYVEGWGLYSELLPKEIGYYQDLYSDFGRLAMELWRACRLVVDVGIHYKKWDRQKAIDYYNNNTPASMGESIGMVDRHIVMPGQATGYKIGMRHILDLREKAKKELKDEFDIKMFHQLILNDGPIPLFMLTKKIDNWIKEEKNKG
jgi:uncharacterized protein (DUF885 family)